MCWLTKAWPSTTRVIVFFRSAPRARIGRFVGKVATAPGAYPRARRRIAGPKRADARDGIVHAARDGPFADQKTVRDTGELLQRVVVFIGDGLAGAIRAGHDQNLGGAGGKQQMMQRRVGQHHAKLIIFRRDSGQFDFRARENDGTGGGLHQGFRLWRKIRPGCARLRYFSPSARTVFLCDIFWRAGR